MNRYEKKITAVILVIILGSCLLLLIFSYYNFRYQKQAATAENNIYEHHISFIINDDGSEFWDAAYAEAAKEAASEGIYVEKVGADLIERFTLSEKMEMAIFGNTEGILVYPEQYDNIVSIIDEAERRGIPVITMLKDSPKSTRAGFVGINDYFIAQAFGRQVQKLKLGDYAGIAVLYPSNAYNEDSKKWFFLGLSNTIDTEHYHIEMKGVNEEDGLTDTEEIINELLAEEEAPGVFLCLDVTTTEIVCRVLKDRGLDGTIKLIGTSQSDTILEGIKDGVIDSSIMTSPYDLGRKSVDALIRYQKYGMVDYYTELTPWIIDRSNVKGIQGADR